MKKFKYRLERVLQYRQALKKEKRNELALKSYELATKEEKLNELLEEQERSDEGLEETAMPASEMMLFGDYRRRLQEALVHQRLLIHEAAMAVDAAREAYIEKAVEAEALETVKKHQFEEFKTEFVRRERKMTDELTVLRHRLPKGFSKKENG